MLCAGTTSAPPSCAAPRPCRPAIAFTSGSPTARSTAPSILRTRDRARNKSMDATIKDFESAIAELETIVKQLEEGDLALEKSLALFERGVQLSRFCHARLEEAERRVEILNVRGEIKPAPAALAGEGDRGR